jgi:hypothetical protein
MIKIDSEGNAFCLSCADEIEGVLVEREEDCTNCSMESTWDKFQKQLQNEEDYSCGACGEICEETDGTVSMNSGLLEFTHKAELCSAQDEVFDYEGTIRFTTDKQLTQEQLNQLMDIIALQIIEPVDENQEDEDYSTRNAEVTVKEVK